jgi:ArsR family transcriptional regulator
MDNSMDPTHFFKCLADETRLKCLFLIQAETELCVCELTEALQLSQPKVSRHLAQLRDGGILAHRRRGQWVHYSIDPQLPAWAQDVLKVTVEANRAYIDSIHKKLCSMGDRPEREDTLCGA